MYETKGAGKRMAQSLEEELQSLIQACEIASSQFKMRDTSPSEAYGA